jgi:hypothetical protein
MVIDPPIQREDSEYPIIEKAIKQNHPHFTPPPQPAPFLTI